MIKVNLLRDGASGMHGMHKSPAVSKRGLIYAAILLLAAGAMAVWGYHLHRQIIASVEIRNRLRIKEMHLSKLKKEIERHQKMKQMHQDRIEGIEQLKESRTGPVLLLNTVLQSIPQEGNLWLTALAQTSDHVEIAGFAQTTDVIPDLMSNLIDSGIFDTVDLEEIENRKGDSKFSLLCRGIKKTRGE